MKKILLIEDNIKIRRYLELELKDAGYSVTSKENGISGLDEAKKDVYDIILLDLGLPFLSGEVVCQKIREFSHTPIIVLTAKDETLTKVALLDIGANDYVTKPFIIEELLARIRVCLRKNSTEIGNNSNNFLTYHNVKIDLIQKMTFVDNIPIQLTKTEFSLLHYLILNKELLLTRDQIISNVWGYDYLGDEKIVDAYIKILRKKLSIDCIKTVRGFGYILKKE